MPILRNTIRRSRRERIRRVDNFFSVFFRIFLVGYFIFAVLVWFSHRDTFRIADVNVEGVQAVDALVLEQTVRSQLDSNLLWKINRSNSLMYPRSSMRSALLKADTRIKDVRIDVNGKLLTVRLSEYSPAFLWCPPGSVSTTTVTMTGCSFADADGYIFSPAPEYSGDPFIVFVTSIGLENSNSVLTQYEFGKVNTFLRKLSDLGLVARVVSQSGEHDFTIMTAEPWDIRWSSLRDPDEDARNLDLVLRNLNEGSANVRALKTIDLRFGNKVFYR